MLSSKSKLSYQILIISVIITGILALYLKPVPHYPNLEFTTADHVQVKHLFQAALDKTTCQIALSSLDEDLSATCPNCKIDKQQCLSKLTTEQQTL